MMNWMVSREPRVDLCISLPAAALLSNQIHPLTRVTSHRCEPRHRTSANIQTKADLTFAARSITAGKHLVLPHLLDHLSVRGPTLD